MVGGNVIRGEIAPPQWGRLSRVVKRDVHPPTPDPP